MNDTGLLSGMYEQIRTHADLIDQVLIRLKAGTSRPTDPARQQLAALLETLSQPRTPDLVAQMLAVLLRGHGGNVRQSWAEVVAALRGADAVPPAAVRGVCRSPTAMPSGRTAASRPRI